MSDDYNLWSGAFTLTSPMDKTKQFGLVGGQCLIDQEGTVELILNSNGVRSVIGESGEVQIVLTERHAQELINKVELVLKSLEALRGE